jgi:hypothetical protein
MQLIELSFGDGGHALELSAEFTPEYCLRITIPERPQHKLQDTTAPRITQRVKLGPLPPRYNKKCDRSRNTPEVP